MGGLKKIGIALLALVVLAMIFGGSSNTSSTSAENKSLASDSAPTTAAPVSKIDHITSFLVLKENDVYKATFTLNDKDDKWVTEDGHVYFKILDGLGKVVYEKEMDVKSTEFKEFYAYKWTFSSAEVKKSTSDMGKAIMTFTTADNKVLNATDTISIPKYTDDEIKQIYEDQYNKNAKVNGTTKTKGNFEITLVKYGFFTHLKYGTSGGEVTDFRVDMKIKNIGSEKDSFRTYDDTILSGANQYKKSFNSELDTTDMYPGVVKEGYLLFENVPNTLTGQIKIIAGASYNAAYHELTTDFDVVV